MSAWLLALLLAGGGDTTTVRPPPASRAWLARLPDGEAKRRFILDCTGCHQFDDLRVLNNGAPRTHAQWTEAIDLMLGFAGAHAGFPVISDDRDAAATATWLEDALAGATTPATLAPIATPLAERAVVTEFDMPVAQDLPHDVAVDAQGRVIVTGMFSHRMFVLDPGTGAVETVMIPGGNAGPRAVELDGAGRWWVLLGGQGKVGRYDPVQREWTTWSIDTYPHSIALAADGAAWYNAHFSTNPVEFGRIDSTGQRAMVRLPSGAGPPANPVPYELRLGPDGRVWMSELLGNRLVMHDPASGLTRAVSMPTSHSGPRRFDVAPDGTLWVPAYGANLLVHYDPATDRFDEIPLPAPDLVPYIARVERRTGHVWIGTAAADAVLRYRPDERAWDVIPVPTQGVTMRHLAVDERTGDVWVAYGASPGTHPSRIARVQVPRP